MAMVDEAYPSPGLPELSDLVPASAKGARKRDIFVTYVRDLTTADLPAIQTGPPKGSVVPTLKRLAWRHHGLAQLVANGRTAEECSAITGYAPSTVYTLQMDPAFKELVAHYAARKESLFLDYADRLGQLGMSAVDELQTRLDENPSQFQSETLRKLMESALDRSGRVSVAGQGGSGGNTGQTPVRVNVTFVNHKPVDAEELTIEGEVLPEDSK